MYVCVYTCMHVCICMGTNFWGWLNFVVKRHQAKKCQRLCQGSWKLHADFMWFVDKMSLLLCHNYLRLDEIMHFIANLLSIRANMELFDWCIHRYQNHAGWFPVGGTLLCLPIRKLLLWLNVIIARLYRLKLQWVVDTPMSFCRWVGTNCMTSLA